MNLPHGNHQEHKTRLLNLAVVGIVGQVGFFTLLIILVALFAGLGLDNRMQTRPLFTLVFLVASVPISLLVMFVVVRFGLARINPGKMKSEPKQQEENDFGNYS